MAEAVNAKVTGKAATDMVLFTGNGTTAAVNKLVHALGLHLPLPEVRSDEYVCVCMSVYVCMCMSVCVCLCVYVCVCMSVV